MHRYITRTLIVAGSIASLAACSPPSTNGETLASGLVRLNIDPFAVTVSGFGSGAQMAQQFHVAQSERVRGAALVGVPPYGCGYGQPTRYLSESCSNPQNPAAAVQQQVEIAQKRAAARQIQSLQNLRNDHLWLMHGEDDATIGRGSFNTVVDFYREFVDSARISVEYVARTGHLWPTVNYGVECSVSESPYLGNCDYDAAELMLSALYGFLLQPEQNEQPLTEFDQRLATTEGTSLSFAKTGLAKRGYAYIPKDCANGAPCSLHISFHGCDQNADSIGRTFAEHSGLNRWAEANRLVILYPQAQASDVNPRACWDGSGYTGPDYATLDGAQIEAMVQLINHIAGVDPGLADF